ncbi:MAG: glycosyltransferase family 2 protein [Pseudomonadota bacterium]
MFGGFYMPHFGHFLTEATGRFWAFDEIDDDLHGLLYFGADKGLSDGASKDFRAILGVIGRDIPCRIVEEPLRIAKLYVPAQGMGAGRMMFGTPEYRAFIKNNTRVTPAPAAPRKLYISRQKNRADRGSFIGEARLEQALVQEGYAVYHPQEDSLEEQLSTYAGAERIVAADGSHFHAVSLVARPDLKVAVIQRRPGKEYDLLAGQLEWFGCHDVLRIPGTGRGWSPGGLRRAGLTLYGEVDFRRLATVLASHGFVSERFDLPSISKTNRLTEITAVGEALDADMYEVSSPGHALSDVPRRRDPGKVAIVPKDGGRNLQDQLNSDAVLVAIMRNEAPYVLEWVAHHRALGFAPIMVFTNDCDDGTDRMLDRLAQLGHVIHAPNPKEVFSQLGVWQVAALRYATAFNAFRDATWVMTLDVDEFLELAPGDGTLGDLFAAAPAFDLMSFPVVGYNSGNVAGIGDGAVQSRFRIPRNPLEAVDRGEVGGKSAVKTLMRNNFTKAQFRNHRPRIDGFSKLRRTWLDAGGRQMPAEFTDHKVNLWSAAGALGFGHVNHHSLRSQESFLVKVMRGDAMKPSRMGFDPDARDNTVRYWKDRNVGLSNAPRTPRMPNGSVALLAEYHADEVLGRMHGAALAAHHAKVEALLDTEAGRDLAKAIGYRLPGGAAAAE